MRASYASSAAQHLLFCLVVIHSLLEPGPPLPAHPSLIFSLGLILASQSIQQLKSYRKMRLSTHMHTFSKGSFRKVDSK